MKTKNYMKRNKYIHDVDSLTQFEDVKNVNQSLKSKFVPTFSVDYSIKGRSVKYVGKSF